MTGHEKERNLQQGTFSEKTFAQSLKHARHVQCTPHTLGSKWRFAQKIKLKAFYKVFSKHSSNIEFVFQLEGLGLKPPSSHSSRNIYIFLELWLYIGYILKTFFGCPPSKLGLEFLLHLLID